MTARPAVTPGLHAPPKHIEVPNRATGAIPAPIRHRRPQTLGWVVLGGFAAVVAVSGLYDLITQASYFGHSLKFGWDHLFTQAWWRQDRHGIRDVMIGVAALPIIKWSAGAWRKHWDEHTPLWQVPARFAALLLVGLAGTIGALWFVTFGIPMIESCSAAHGACTTHVAWYQIPPQYSGAVYFAVGLVIGHLVRPVWRRAATAIQRYWAEVLVTGWRRTGRVPAAVALPLLPPALRELAAWMHDEGVPCEQRGRFARAELALGAVTLLALVGVGIAGKYFKVFA